MNKKNANAKIDIELFNEFKLLAWFLGKNRSEIFRMAIDHFVMHGTIVMKREEYTYDEALALALVELENKGQTIEEFLAPEEKEQTSKPNIPEKLQQAEQLLKDLRKDFASETEGEANGQTRSLDEANDRETTE